MAARIKGSALEEEACRRLKDARRQKSHFERDMMEAYFFAAPHRARSVNSTSHQDGHWKPQDAAELNTSFAMELAGDFATVVVNAFFPQGEQWAMRKATAILPEGARDQVEMQAQTEDRAIFMSLGESNFYAEVGKGFIPDLAIGTVAIWIDQPYAHKPVRCMSVPLRELEINIGPHGNVDDRFIVRHTRMHHLEALLPGVTLPPAIAALRDKDGDKHCEVVRGFWRVYDTTGVTRWRYVAMVDEMIVEDRELTGEGSCPLIVGRFNATADYAWGLGPLLQGLPDLRVVDEMAMLRIKMIGMTLEPPISFPDDSFINIEEGIESGMAYKVRPGSEGAIKNIYQPPAQDPAIYFTNDQETRLKRIFFLDYPDQPGKTPPTATQWLDEMTMAQRRIGTPGLSFWHEFPAEVFVRFEALGVKAGMVKALADADGKAQGGMTRLHPYNPAQKAIEQQDVAQFTRFAQIGTQITPEEWKLYTDGKATLLELAKKMGVDDIWKQRSAADTQKALQTIQQLQSGSPGQVPNGPPTPSTPTPDPGAPPINPTLQLRSQAA